MITAIIVDDEKSGRTSLARLLEIHCPDVKVLAEAGSAKKAIEAIKQYKPALVFLDIEMPGGSGFKVLESLDAIDFQVIFVTAYQQYAIKAIRFAALDYLLKPVIAAELKEAVERFRTAGSGDNGVTAEQIRLLQNHILHDEMPEKLALPTAEGFLFVELRDIIRCSAHSNYTKFFLASGSQPLVPKTLGEFEELLENNNFIRVHNSHLVNLRFVDKYMKGRGGYIVMQDGNEVEVSVRRKDKFLERFLRL